MIDKPPNGMEHRITALEHGLSYFRETVDERHNTIQRALTAMHARNEKQDKTLTRQIEQIYRLIWQIIRWSLTFLAGTLIMIVLKALKLL